MGESGLLAPILVRFDDYDTDTHLVAGHTRLLAARRLGWEMIDSIVIDCTAAEAEIIEIDENLRRSDLTQAQRDQHLIRRKEVWEELRRMDAPKIKRGRGRPKGFATTEAERTGKSKSQVNRDVARANGKQAPKKSKPAPKKRVAKKPLDLELDAETPPPPPPPGRKVLSLLSDASDLVKSVGVKAVAGCVIEEELGTVRGYLGALAEAIETISAEIAAKYPAPLYRNGMLVTNAGADDFPELPESLKR
jgi:hypothetical protein